MSDSYACPQCSGQMEQSKTLMTLVQVKQTTSVPQPKFKQDGVGLMVSLWRGLLCGFVELYAP
jgi:hypothetical protein